jgi:hypothetical protein
VFDGHGGSAASAYLQQNLHAVLQRTLEQARASASGVALARAAGGGERTAAGCARAARRCLPPLTRGAAPRAQDPDAAYDSTLCARPSARRALRPSRTHPQRCATSSLCGP